MRKYRSDGWWVAGWPSTGKIGEATECYHRHIFSHWFASIASIASIASLGIVQRSQMPTSDFSGKAGTPKVQKGRFRESSWSLRSSQALHRSTMQINDEQWWSIVFFVQWQVREAFSTIAESAKKGKGKKFLLLSLSARMRMRIIGSGLSVG